MDYLKEYLSTIQDTVAVKETYEYIQTLKTDGRHPMAVIDVSQNQHVRQLKSRLTEDQPMETEEQRRDGEEMKTEEFKVFLMIAARSLCIELIRKTVYTDEKQVEKLCFDLLFCALLVTHLIDEQKLGIDELPCLLETFFRALPVNTCVKLPAMDGTEDVKVSLTAILWLYLSSKKEMIKADKRSHRIVLRVANMLLLKLSGKEEALLRGRVLCLVAYVLPLDDRGGVNLLGAVNESTFLDIETEEAFKQNETGESENVQQEVKDGRKRGTSYSLAPQQPVPLEVDYRLYRTLWAVLQSGKSSLKAESNSQSHRAFFTNDNLVYLLGVLERLTRSDSQRKGDKMLTPGLSQSKVSLGVETRHLSNSRLFSLQLFDSDFRRLVLIQLCFLLQIGGTSSNVQSSSALTVKQKERLTERVALLLKATGSSEDSLDLSEFIRSEVGFQSWKKRKCPTFKSCSTIDKTSYESLNTAAVAADQKPKKRKHAAIDQNSSSTGAATTSAEPQVQNDAFSRNTFLWRDRTATWKTTHAKVVANLSEKRENFLNPMFEALDPDNMIEEAYHPKNSTVYCWKGFRNLHKFCSLAELRNCDANFFKLCENRYKASK